MSSTKPVTAAPSGKPKRKKQWTRVGIPPHVCIVCGDGAYGYNFGQITCESCKAFFRRHINKPRSYVCPGDRQCTVSCKTRKYCPACRLRKCFDVGLKPDIARITNQLREEKREARKTKNHMAKRSSNTSECDSEVKTRSSKRVAKQTQEQSSSAQTVKPKSQTTVPTMRTRRKTRAAQDTPQAVTPSGSGQQDGSESPRLDASSASVSPPLVTSPVVNATCDTPSTQCWSVSIPSCASLNFPLSTEALSPDGQVDEKPNLVAYDASNPCGSLVFGAGGRAAPYITQSRKDDTAMDSNQPPKFFEPSASISTAGNSVTVRPELCIQERPLVLNGGSSQIAPPPSVLSKYNLDDFCFSCMRTVCNKLLMTMLSPFTTSEISFLGPTLMPETMSELLAIAETSMRRFVRYTKQFEDFRDNFSFDEKVSILRRAVLTCHIFTFSFGFDVETRERLIPLVDGTQRVLTGAHIAELKRRAGLPEHNDPRPAYIRVHSDIRARFPRTWRTLVAALSLVALFTPKFQLRKSANSVAAQPNSQSKSDLSCLNLENKSSDNLSAKLSASSNVSTPASEIGESDASGEAAIQLAAKMRPFYQRYKAFLPRYIEYVEGVCLSEDEKRDIVRFCKKAIDDAHEIATNITTRVGFMAMFDPSALSLIPLYNELMDS